MKMSVLVGLFMVFAGLNAMAGEAGVLNIKDVKCGNTIVLDGNGIGFLPTTLCKDGAGKPIDGTVMTPGENGEMAVKLKKGFVAGNDFGAKEAMRAYVNSDAVERIYTESGMLEKVGGKDGVGNYYEDNKLVQTFERKGDKKHGKETLFYADGSLKAERYYQEDRLEGEAKEYFPGGKLARTAFYKNGKLNGAVVQYYWNGSKEFEASYKDDALDGEKIEYFDNGAAKVRAHYKNGELNGDYVEYSKNGVVIKEDSYRNGVRFIKPTEALGMK